MNIEHEDADSFEPADDGRGGGPVGSELLALFGAWCSFRMSVLDVPS